jgi:hypothetical protein
MYQQQAEWLTWRKSAVAMELQMMAQNQSISDLMGMDGSSAGMVSNYPPGSWVPVNLPSTPSVWTSVQSMWATIRNTVSRFMKSTLLRVSKGLRSPAMPRTSAISCKLNSKFASSDRFYTKTKSVTGAYYSYPIEGLGDREKKHVLFEPSVPGCSCCGLEELDFTPLMKHWETYQDEGDDVWMEMVSAYIQECFGENDNRVMFVGLPTKVGGGSMYNIDFYRRLRKVLKKIGFREVCRPYKNANSGNTIVVLVGQLP